MKNKKYIKLICFSGFILLLLIFISNKMYYKVNDNYNNKIVQILNTVKEKYPKVSDSELIEIINSNSDNELMNKYSYDLDKLVIVKDNKNIYIKYYIMLISLFVIVCLVYLISYILIDKKKKREINKIIKIIEDINNKNYKFNIDDVSEDDLSILKNEIYKTTIMLNELSEISLKDKKELEESLSDISHQLKTPLTSILIMIDTLLDNKEMDDNTREEFLRDIKRNIMNINFLVKSILKLSRLDTNTVKFVNKKENVKEILNDVIFNVSLLSDLKCVLIELDVSDIYINCDYRWQVEAITNILKNSIEHSYEDSKVRIRVRDNNSYVKIEIKDYGTGIDKEDIGHIFERFYKGKNSDYDSIGIGLALSKSIIEKQNGKISVVSDNKGTTFIIKYYK